MIQVIVEWACRRAWAVVLVGLALSLSAALYVAAHVSVHTEMAALIPADVPWRIQTRALEKAFVQQGDDIAVVIDGQTPELAEDAAGRLTAALSARHDRFRVVEQPGGGTYFQREGILFLSVEEVRALCDGLIRAQPLLASVAADPSLRGVLKSLSLVSEAVTAGQADPEQVAGPLGLIADKAELAAQHRPAFLSWSALLTGRAAQPGSARQIVEIFPNPDDSGARGQSDLALVRATAKPLGLDPAHGVSLRLTGEIPMRIDELATLGEATGPMAIAAGALVLTILFLAVRSPKIVGAITLTVLAGLSLTAASGLAAYGQFNLISVAFLPLFVGLGIDFAIQVAVRYRAEALTEADIATALSKTGAGVGHGLFLAAAATGLSFLAFLPTRYQGVAELGGVAGIGMAVAFLLAITLLPALLTITRARSPAPSAGFLSLRNADAAIQARRGAILGAAALLALAAAAASPALRFDFDPLSLRNPHTQSVATFLELSRDPDTAPDTLEVLAPDITASRALAARLRRLPQVREVRTIESLIPPDQTPKLAIIRDASLLLDATINPFDAPPPPSDADLVASLGKTAASLRALAAAPAGASVARQALRLAVMLEAAQLGPPSTRDRLQLALTGGLPSALAQVRALLAAERVGLETLPAALKADWTASDGRARIETLPRAPHADRRGISDYLRAVVAVAPDASGTPRAIEETQVLILGAFRQAAGWSLLTIVALLAITLRRARAVLLTLAPVALIGLLTVGTCVVARLAINLENLIALLLLIGVGVSFNIYYVVAWFRGERALLPSSLTRAVVYSALATGAGFGTLSLSRHPGTASMGSLLLISLFWTLAVTLIVQPALLGVAGGRDSTASLR